MPTAVAAVLFVNSVRSQQYAGPGDPHVLYAGAWFIFLEKGRREAIADIQAEAQELGADAVIGASFN